MNTLIKIVDFINISTTPTPQKATMVVDNIRAQVKNYVARNGLKSLVVGISGGLDSSVIAALCQEKYTGVPLIGISIPMSSSTAHKEQAQWVGENYCNAFQEFTGWDEEWQETGEGGACGATTNMLSEVLATVKQTDSLAKQAGFEVDVVTENVLQGNIKARLRMITLMDVARKTSGMVLGTGQLSEDEYMKFFTLGGDDRTDFDCIHNIGKGFEVPALARTLGIRDDIISQPPSDGLSVTDENTDEAQLGANYQEIDTIMSIYLGNLPVPNEIKDMLKVQLFNLVETDLEGAKKVAKVISRYETFKFKFNGTVYLTREQIGLN